MARWVHLLLLTLVGCVSSCPHRRGGSTYSVGDWRSPGGGRDVLGMLCILRSHCLCWPMCSSASGSVSSCFDSWCVRLTPTSFPSHLSSSPVLPPIIWHVQQSSTPQNLAWSPLWPTSPTSGCNVFVLMTCMFPLLLGPVPLYSVPLTTIWRPGLTSTALDFACLPLQSPDLVAGCNTPILTWHAFPLHMGCIPSHPPPSTSFGQSGSALTSSNLAWSPLCPPGHLS